MNLTLQVVGIKKLECESSRQNSCEIREAILVYRVFLILPLVCRTYTRCRRNNDSIRRDIRCKGTRCVEKRAYYNNFSSNSPGLVYSFSSRVISGGTRNAPREMLNINRACSFPAATIIFRNTDPFSHSPPPPSARPVLLPSFLAVTRLSQPQIFTETPDVARNKIPRRV